MSNIRDYQVDHLLLLVGSNPLPNAVAGKLLTTTADTITLIHSADGLLLAQRLKSWFLDEGYSDTNIGFKQVEESDAASVYQGVSRVLDAFERDHGNASKARLGLNYTGGTKVMAVQTYRALENWARFHSREAVFSYLDARTLKMRIERVPGGDTISFYVGLGVDINIHDLLKLHNWGLIKAPLTVPVLPESAKALLAVHSNPTHAEIWTKWLNDELSRNARKSIPNGKWKSNTELQKLAISWPNLSVLKETMSNELGQDGIPHLNLTSAKGRGCKNEEDFCKWLSGVWLESAVLSVLQNCPQKLHLKECCMDLVPKAPGSSGTNFQFDVVALRGYQIFAFSCTTVSGKESGDIGLLKHKLFEAYVRARQMGGDEACVALVCCVSQAQADKIEDEMRRDISPEGRIRVFGRERLENLIGEIVDWVRQQSKEV